MGPPTANDLRLRLPGFRRYRLELARLRQQEAEAAALRDRITALEGELAVHRGARGLAGGGDPAPPDAEWLARAKRFEFYWRNADKKIDLLATRPFGPVAQRVLGEGRTFLDADRLYTLWQAVTEMPQDAAAVAEVGVFKGGSARLIAEALRHVGRELPFFACDTFRGHAVVNEALDGRHRVGRQFRSPSGESHAPKVIRYLRHYPFVTVLEGDIRETAARFDGEQAFGMVHLDVDVHPITQWGLEFFGPRLRPGAMIVVDDYGFTTCPGVKVAVDEFVAAHRREYRALHLITGQAVVIRLA